MTENPARVAAGEDLIAAYATMSGHELLKQLESYRDYTLRGMPDDMQARRGAVAMFERVLHLLANPPMPEELAAKYEQLRAQQDILTEQLLELKSLLRNRSGSIQ